MIPPHPPPPNVFSLKETETTTPVFCSLCSTNLATLLGLLCWRRSACRVAVPHLLDSPQWHFQPFPCLLTRGF